MADDPSWLEHDGGHLALDLVNTVSWRHDPDRREEHLDGPAALEAWTAARGLPVISGASERQVTRLRLLRDAVHALVLDRSGETARLPGLVPYEDAHTYLTAATHAAVTRSKLDIDEGARWVADPSNAFGLHDHLALVAFDLFATADDERLRRCADPHCGWVFLDRSRSGTRTWCSPSCGNRVRARRHADRRRRAAG